MPDREQVDRFVRAVFADATVGSFVRLRSFCDDGRDGHRLQARGAAIRAIAGGEYAKLTGEVLS